MSVLTDGKFPINFGYYQAFGVAQRTPFALHIRNNANSELLEQYFVS